MPSVSIPVAAAAGVGGAVLSSNAAKSAASTQAQAATTAAQAAENQYNQTRTDLQPFTTAGTNALGTLETTLGLPGGNGTNALTANGLSGLTFQPTQAQLAATPGYQFDLNQGIQAAQNSNSATGNGVSGNALKGAAAFATGLANNTLTTQQGIFQQNLGNVLNPLTNLVNVGQNAAATTGQQGIQATQNANALNVGGANALAAGQVGSANALTSGLTTLGNSPLNYALYNQLLNPSSSGGGYVDTTSTF